MASPDLTLALVIPVWNLPAELGALLAQVADLGIFSQVIVCDDASEQNCDPQHLGFDQDRLGAELIYLRSETRGGAGRMRNAGLDRVTADCVIFFDADDQLEAEFNEIWARHKDQISGGQEIDFTIFRHVDSRVEAAEERRGSFLPDEAMWDEVLGNEDEGSLGVSERAQFCTLANYPWNKIYRTGFLLENGIRCSETPVHNDILLHWTSFSKAKRVHATRMVGASHIVTTQGAHHLTNRKGLERLCLFDILEEVRGNLRNAPHSFIFLPSFVHFTHSVCQWSLQVVDTQYRDEFVNRIQKLYRSFLSSEFTLYALSQPSKADEMLSFISKGKLR
jgi:glycosyltransferase involved in cell wall biosynthesis